MYFLISLLTFVLVAYHVRIRRVPTPRQVAAYVAATNAVVAFSAGFYLAVQEDARARYGRTVVGTITERISSTGEQGTRTMGADRRADVRTSERSDFYDLLARRVVAGSADVWVIDYGFDCGKAHTCWGRDFVRHDLWSRLRAGAAVRVRYVPDGVGGARLEDNPQWTTAVAEMTVGALLMLVAAGIVGALPTFVRRVQRLETMAVVTAVDEVHYRGAMRWRVRFSYLDDLGGPHEAVDEFAVNTWKPGDSGIAVYEVAQPEVAGLRPTRATKSG